MVAAAAPTSRSSQRGMTPRGGLEVAADAVPGSAVRSRRAGVGDGGPGRPRRPARPAPGRAARSGRGPVWPAPGTSGRTAIAHPLPRSRLPRPTITVMPRPVGYRRASSSPVIAGSSKKTAVARALGPPASGSAPAASSRAHGVGRLPEDRGGQRRLPAVVGPRVVGAAVEQGGDRVRVAVVGGQDQQGVALVVGEVHRARRRRRRPTRSSVQPPRARSKTRPASSMTPGIDRLLALTAGTPAVSGPRRGR